MNVFDKIKEDGLGEHYYGDIVRRFFVLGALIMAITLPFFHEIIPVPTLTSLALIAIVGVMAGLTNPRQAWVALLNVFISLGGVVAFEYYAVSSFDAYGVDSLFFWTNQFLAVIFLFALYWSSKTIRGMLISKG